MTVAAALFAATAAAQEGPATAQARAAGLIGERYDGYIGLVTAVSPAVSAGCGHQYSPPLALFEPRGTAWRDPRGSRHQHRLRMLDRVGVGQAYQLANGGWQPLPGQAAPRRDIAAFDFATAMPRFAVLHAVDLSGSTS